MTDRNRNCMSCRWWNESKDKCMNTTPTGTELGDDIDSWISDAQDEAREANGTQFEIGSKPPCLPTADGCPGHSFKPEAVDDQG